MQIFNKKMYRIISDEKKDYIVDFSLNKYSCLFGVHACFFPVYGYEVRGEKVIHNKETGVMISIILYLIMFFSLILASVALDVFPIFFTTQQKLIICVVVYILSYFYRRIRGGVEQKKFTFYNSKTKKDIVKFKIHFKSIWFVLKVLLFNLLINYLIVGGAASVFVLVVGSESLLPTVIIAINFFVSFNEMKKIPFSRNDIKKIKILENKEN